MAILGWGMSLWAIDAGTTHTSVARWESRELVPVMVHLPDICRLPHPQQRLDVRHAVPSEVFLLPGEDLATRMGRWPLLRRTLFLGREAFIGRQARERDGGLMRPHFVSSFKSALLREPGRVLASFGGRPYSATQIFQIFLRELLSECGKVCGERPRDLVFSVPVDSYETYRAHLQQGAVSLGVRKVRFIDEPVAAAMGYGLRLDVPRQVLVIDFGGGTLDIALVLLDPTASQQGRCEIRAKEGIPLGGNLVDQWVAAAWYDAFGFKLDANDPDPNRSWWYRIMLEEACRVKEGLFFNAEETFFMEPPPELHRVPERVRRGANGTLELTFSRRDLVAILEQRGLYRELDRLLDGVLDAAAHKGTRLDDIADVLLVGGSTLLPEFYARVEARFGRERVRAWQPFDAVAYGAASFAAGAFIKNDFVTHDYGIRLWRSGRQGVHEDVQVVVRAGTSFPSEGPVWRHLMTPVCSLGEPESVFKLVICELGRAHSQHQELFWDARGALHVLDGQASEAPVVVPLNELNPALGVLDPPHPPGERAARLDVAFGINSERWLIATVLDLKTQKVLMKEQPVVRLQ